jgi:DNA-binding transcriptional ArsR family regulator
MPARRGSGIALLADPTRRRIIGAIALRPRRPSLIARELRLSRPVVSRHLRLLREAGLVVQHRSLIDGRWTMYAVNTHRHGAITAWLAGTEVARDGNPPYRHGNRGPETPEAHDADRTDPVDR